MTQTTEENSDMGLMIKLWLFCVLVVIVSWYFVDVRSANFWESTVAFYVLCAFGFSTAVLLFTIMFPAGGGLYGGDGGGPWFDGNGEGGGGDGGGW